MEKTYTLFKFRLIFTPSFIPIGVFTLILGLIQGRKKEHLWNFFLHLSRLSLNRTFRLRPLVPKIWPKLKTVGFISLEAEENGVLDLTAWYKAEKSHPTSRSILSCFEGETSAESTSGWAHWEPTWPETETWTPEDSHCEKQGEKMESMDFMGVTEVKCCDNYLAVIRAHFWSDTIQ